MTTLLPSGAAAPSCPSPPPWSGGFPRDANPPTRSPPQPWSEGFSGGPVPSLTCAADRGFPAGSDPSQPTPRSRPSPPPLPGWRKCPARAGARRPRQHPRIGRGCRRRDGVTRRAGAAAGSGGAGGRWERRPRCGAGMAAGRGRGAGAWGNGCFVPPCGKEARGHPRLTLCPFTCCIA